MRAIRKHLSALEVQAEGCSRGSIVEHHVEAVRQVRFFRPCRTYWHGIIGPRRKIACPDFLTPSARPNRDRSAPPAPTPGEISSVGIEPLDGPVEPDVAKACR